MKNMKVSVKLIVSFLLVIVLTAAVGVVGIVAMSQMNDGIIELYERQTVPLVDLAYAREFFQRLRSELRNLMIASGDDQWLNTIEAAIVDYEASFLHYMGEFGATIVDPAVRAAYDVTFAGFTRYMEHTYGILSGARDGMPLEELIVMMRAAVPDATVASDGMSDMMYGRVAQAVIVYEEAESLYGTMLIAIIAVILVAIAVAIFLSLYVSGLISKPLVVLTAFMKKAAKTGDIQPTVEEREMIGKFAQNKDELGQCIAATSEFVTELNTEMDLLEKVADGDLTIAPKALSDKDRVGNSLVKVVDSLNNMFSEINNASGQVSAGSKQISDGAQSLAQGSTEQAASVQQLSSSISEIAQKTKGNAEMAGRAASLATNIKASAEKGSGQMGEMMTAVKDINESSQNISKVIKSIDDIAFQTNILALNAAVEAARAGQHGKGFAVVAEEVRNLAAKSAEAAKDTESLIADSIAKAELGSKIADETSESLTEIVQGIDESTKLVGDIAKSSEEQAAGIEQINKGVDQVAQVVQQNSATAEESAAASQQMSGQSLMLEELISRFKLKSSNNTFQSLPASAAPAPQANLPAPSDSLDSLGDFGKY